MKASLNQSLSFYLSTYLTTVFIPSSWTHECAWLPRAFDCEGWRWLGERQPEKQTQNFTLHQEHFMILLTNMQRHPIDVLTILRSLRYLL